MTVFDHHPPGRYPSGPDDEAPTYGTIAPPRYAVVLQTIRVTTAAQVEQMRIIRNHDRDGYSTPTDEITPDQQARWWNGQRGNLRAWLYLDTAGETVGFGLVRRGGDGRWCPSVGVLPEYRGKGFGSWIIRDLTRQAPTRLWAQARRDNEIGCRTHAAQDWEEIDGPDPAFRYFRARFDPTDDAALLADSQGRWGFQWGYG